MTTAQILSPSPAVESGFTATRREVVDALAAVGLAVPRRPVHRVMSGVLVTSKAASTTFTATDYDTAIQVTVPSSGSDGQWLLSHDELTRMLAAAGKGDPKKVADAMPVSIGSDPATGEPMLTAGGFSVPMSHDLDIADYPDAPGRPAWVATVNRDALAAAVKRVMTACGNDEMLPVLTHVQMVVESGLLRLETTDRFRVTLATVPVIGPSVDAQALVPGRLLAAAMKHLTEETVSVRIGSPSSETFKRAVLVSGSVEVSMRAGDGQFPKVRGLVPTEATVTATVPLAALTKAARKAAAMQEARDGRNTAVALSLSHTGVTVAPTVADSHAKVSAPEVAATVDGLAEGATFETGFNPRFLLDLLTGFTGESVTLHFTRPANPVTVTEQPDGLTDPAAFKHLLMPRRLLS